MKVILTGSTGMIGTEVLFQCLNNPLITSIIVLTRRPLPDSVPSSPKLKVIIHEDFLAYPPAILQELAGAEACIWSLGQIHTSSVARQREVNVTYPLNFSRAIIPVLGPGLHSTGSKFKFIYISGLAAERDAEKKLWLLGDARRIKGEIETQLVSLADLNHEIFTAYLLRPGSVVPRNSISMTVLGALTNPIYPAMKVEELAAATISLAIHGIENENGKLSTSRERNDGSTIGHGELKRRGKEALELAKAINV